MDCGELTGGLFSTVDLAIAARSSRSWWSAQARRQFVCWRV